MDRSEGGKVMKKNFKVGMIIKNFGQEAMIIATRKQDDMLLVKGTDEDGLMWVADPERCVIVRQVFGRRG